MAGRFADPMPPARTHCKKPDLSMAGRRLRLLFNHLFLLQLFQLGA